MSIVARGVRYQASATAPPNWWGTAIESSISCTATILPARPPRLPLAHRQAVLTDARRSSTRRASTGNPSGSNGRAGRLRVTASAKPSRSISAAPGSVDPVAGGPCKASAIRREASTNRLVEPSGFHPARAVTRAPARRPEASTASTSKGRCARRAALARTSSPRTSNPARLRARGPLAVCIDSRISNRPFGRATTKAIPTRIPLYPLVGPDFAE